MRVFDSFICYCIISLHGYIWTDIDIHKCMYISMQYASMQIDVVFLFEPLHTSIHTCICILYHVWHVVWFLLLFPAPFLLVHVSYRWSFTGLAWWYSFSWLILLFVLVTFFGSLQFPNPYVSWQNLMKYVTHPYVTHPTFSGWHPTSLLVQSLPSELQLAFSEGALCTQTLVTLQNFGPPLGTSHHWGTWGSLNKLNEITMHTHARARTRTRIYIYIHCTHTHTLIYIYMHACARACACVFV